MPGIFLSYRRRGESAGYAGHLADELRDRFGPEQLFRDIDTIPPGQDFVKVIAGAVGACDVLLALIGPDWLTAKDPSGRRRLDDPDDFIRHEIAAALSRDIPVIPVLVGGATMPTAADLPEPLKALARRQASELSDARWDFDVQKLIAAIKRAGVRTVGQKGPPVERRWLARGAIALLAVAVLWAGWKLLLAPRITVPQIEVFEAAPPRIHAGESVALRWRTSNAEQVSLEGNNVWPSDTVDVDPVKTTTYHLVARSRAARADRSVTVEVTAPLAVNRPAILSFQADPSTINPGEAAVLHWHTANAHRVALDGKSVPPAEATTVNPAATTTYTLVATNERGDQDSKTVTVRVTATPVKPRVEFRAFPTTVMLKQPVRLCWVILNAGSARIDPDVGPLQPNQVRSPKDCLSVTPLKTTTYTLTAVGERGATQTDTATVQVRPKPLVKP